MARLTEEMVIARSKQSDFSAIKKLNCWGAELGDVSVLRRMPNVEVLALSINKIRSLGDFAACRRLRELYVRKNEIRDLREIRHLRRLPLLTSLWLDENPCTQHPEYRATVLRNLPNLEKLDNVPVHPEEVAEAQRRGSHIPDSDDEGYVQQETYAAYRRRRSSASSEPEHEPEPQPQPERDDQPERRAPRPAPAAPAPPAARELSSDSSEGADTLEQRHEQCPLSPTRRAAHSVAGGHSPECDERYDHPAMTRSQYEPRPTSGALPHSLSAQCVKDYSYSSNGDCRYGGVGATGTGVLGTTERGVVSPPHYHDAYYERGDRPESSTAAGPTRFEREWEGARERDREYPSAVMAEHRGFTRRPVARNSNLLSAVLCLVKELDYPSLEVAEMAVRCRMDELANSQ